MKVKIEGIWHKIDTPQKASWLNEVIGVVLNPSDLTIWRYVRRLELIEEIKK
jgi:hypothetical protein